MLCKSFEVKDFFLFPNRAGGQKCKKIEYQKTKLPLVLREFFHARKKENFQ
jgi:hypothetical protein